ncbi:MAG: RdgB/HAM1 family non-canonical purine NTP pyrophosphatase [Planctomycetota bacterium]
MKPSEIIFGTRNLHKLQEVQTKLAKGTNLKIWALSEFDRVPEVEEDLPDLEGNSRKKAEIWASILKRWVLADDSGLMVDALQGRPGVYSARYSGEKATAEQNNTKLLQEMSTIPDPERTARFRCVLTLASPEGMIFQVSGSLEGKIAMNLRGHHGFGYDPLFILKKNKRFEIRLAELSLEKKNKISHRARALEQFMLHWKRLPKI